MIATANSRRLHRPVVKLSITPRACLYANYSTSPVKSTMRCFSCSIDSRRRFRARSWRLWRWTWRSLAFETLDFLFEARLFGVEVDQAGKRDQQFHLANNAGCGRRLHLAGSQPALRFDAREKRDLRAEFLRTRPIAVAATGEQQRNGCPRRDIHLAAGCGATCEQHGAQPFRTVRDCILLPRRSAGGGLSNADQPLLR